MSISSTTRKAGPYSGNGTTTSFPFAFKVFNKTDLLVQRNAGVDESLTLDQHYTVTLNQNQDTNPGGVVNFVTAPAVGVTLKIISNVPMLQPIILTNQGGFFPKTINDGFDRCTILIQQLGEESADFSDELSAVQDKANDAWAASQDANTKADSANTAAASANNKAAAAESKANDALAAATSPTAAAIATYLDSNTGGNTMSYSAMRISGVWDMGDLSTSTGGGPFTNESTNRKASMSTGSGSFDFGTL